MNRCTATLAAILKANGADRRGDALNVIFSKLDETGTWVKSNPKEAAALLAGHSGASMPRPFEQANGHRSYRVGTITPEKLSNTSGLPMPFMPRSASCEGRCRRR